MASEMALSMRTPADSIAGSLGRRLANGGDMMAHGMSRMPDANPPNLPGEFSIPYGFPRSGRYRIWIQVKRDGAVQTAAFDTEVEPAKSPS